MLLVCCVVPYRFRIFYDDLGSEVTVYDNQLGDADDADANTVIIQPRQFFVYRTRIS